MNTYHENEGAMKQAFFNLNRDHYGMDDKKRETTLGKMIRPNNTFFGFVLEDVVRPYGVKRKTSTAIPATEGDFSYKMGIRTSPKYGEVVVIYTSIENDSIYVLEHGGIRFEYVLCHGGNHADHTDACLLMNKNRKTKDGEMTAWGSMKTEILNEVKALEAEGYDVRLRVTNLPQVA
jgi:hypothetical protein